MRYAKWCNRGGTKQIEDRKSVVKEGFSEEEAFEMGMDIIREGISSKIIT